MRLTLLCAMACILAATAAPAGVVNPDISVIGQPVLSLTDDPGNPDHDRPKLDPGETEFVFDAYLNPFAKGLFTLSLGEEGLDLEEGYFTVFRGLPLGLNAKGGKYRVGFGKLNPMHPHTYPFGERFGVLAAYLPGDEAFNETGLSISEQVPLIGNASLTGTVDYLQGDSFRIDREPAESPDDPLISGGGDEADRTRPGAVARLSNFTMIGEQSGLELGVSAAHGTNNVAAQARTTIFGLDAKAKIWSSSSSYVVLQGELLKLRREDASWSPEAGYSKETVDPLGAYAFADWNFARRYNAGASVESYQEPTPEKGRVQAIGAFAGYAVMEETLLFRLVYNRAIPEAGDPTNTVSLHVVYSMGPHKAHQF